jgi:hypothetical protein
MTYGCLEAPQVKSFDEALLERRQGSVRDDRKGSAVGIDERHFLDLGQGGENFHDAEIDSLLGEGSTQQGAEEESQNAVEGMDANLLIGPVMQRPPADKVGILHSFEGLLNMVPESGVKEPILAQVMARSFAILVRMWWAKFSIWGVL